MSSSRQPLLVAVVGGSGSGKSWLADKLAATLAPKAARLSLDDFYRDQSHLPPARRARINFDHPRTIDWPAFKDVLRTLLANKPARIPCYDFATHSRLAKSTLLKPKPFIIIDGLWLLRRPSLRGLFAYSLFLECSVALRLRRRLVRDRAARGRTLASICDQFCATVHPMHERFVAPQIRLADAVFRGVPKPEQISKLATHLRHVGSGAPR